MWFRLKRGSDKKWVSISLIHFKSPSPTKIFIQQTLHEWLKHDMVKQANTIHISPLFCVMKNMVKGKCLNGHGYFKKSILMISKKFWNLKIGNLRFLTLCNVTHIFDLLHCSSNISHRIFPVLLITSPNVLPRELENNSSNRKMKLLWP